MIVWRGGLVVALSAALAACGGSSPRPTPEQLPAAQKEFESCVNASPRLVVSHQRAANGLEVIDARTRHVVVAEFGLLPSVQAAKTLINSLAVRSGRIDARLDRYVLFTTPAVQDAEVTPLNHCLQATPPWSAA